MIDARRKLLALLLSAGACTLLLGAAAADNRAETVGIETGGAQAGPQPTRASWRSPKGDPARGKELAAICLTCHAEDSPPTDPPAPKLHRQRMSYVFFALQDYRDGRRESAIMQPIVAEMSDQDMRDVAAYLAGELLDRPPDAHTDDPYYQRTLRDCTWCHGETGIGEFEGMPVITGQDPAYLAAALEEYRSGIRKNPTMEPIAAQLTPEDIRGLAAYYSSYKWLEKNK